MDERIRVSFLRQFMRKVESLFQNFDEKEMPRAIENFKELLFMFKELDEIGENKIYRILESNLKKVKGQFTKARKERQREKRLEKQLKEEYLKGQMYEEKYRRVNVKMPKTLQELTSEEIKQLSPEMKEYYNQELWNYYLGLKREQEYTSTLEDDEVTHTNFFGENLARVRKAFFK